MRGVSARAARAARGAGRGRTDGEREDVALGDRGAAHLAELRRELVVLVEALRAAAVGEREVRRLAVLDRDHLDDRADAVAHARVLRAVAEDALRAVVQRLEHVRLRERGEHGELLRAEREDRHGVGHRRGGAARVDRAAHAVARRDERGDLQRGDAERRDREAAHAHALDRREEVEARVRGLGERAEQRGRREAHVVEVGEGVVQRGRAAAARGELPGGVSGRGAGAAGGLPGGDAGAHVDAVVEGDDEGADAAVLGVDDELGEHDGDAGHADGGRRGHESAGVSAGGGAAAAGSLCGARGGRVEVEGAVGAAGGGGLHVDGVEAVGDLGEAVLGAVGHQRGTCGRAGGGHARDLEGEDAVEEGPQLGAVLGALADDADAEVVLDGEEGHGGAVEAADGVLVHVPEALGHVEDIVDGEGCGG